MEIIDSIPSIKLEELKDYIDREGIILVAINGKPALIFSNGELRKVLIKTESVMRNVSVYALDVWELLDVLNGAPLPQTKPPTPKSFELSLQLDVPPELLLKVEKGILTFLKKAIKEKKAAIYEINAKAYIRQGFTGMNILIMRLSIRGYISEDTSSGEIIKGLERVLEKETGFETKIILKECKVKRTKTLPIVKFQGSNISYKGGRIVRVPLRNSVGNLSLNQDKLEEEVNRFLKEANLPNSLIALKTGTSREMDIRKIESEILQATWDIVGIHVKWVKLSPSHKGYKLVIGADRTQRSVSDFTIAEKVAEVLKDIEESLTAVGYHVFFEDAYIVLEHDVY